VQTSRSGTTIAWFRRDLRLGDNPALEQAAAAGSVVGAFVADPVLLGPAGGHRVGFLRGSVDHLRDRTGGGLVVRAGRPADVLASLAAEVGATSVVAAADSGPYGRRRDEAVAARLEADGIPLHLVGSPYAVAPGTLRTQAGSPYAVFTPFFRAWLAAGWPRPAAEPTVDWITGVPSSDLPASGPAPAAFPPGEAAAWDRLEAFLDRVAGYAEDRNRPDLDHTSRLSPYLRFGCIHPRQVLDRLGDRRGEAAYRRELCWRDFYADVLHHRPATAREALQSRMAALPVDDGPTADTRFEAWAAGRTGYPLVDAGMRQLIAEGWMHNRVRMLVASFLVKDLHLPWQRGARHFMQHLVDGDLASNSHGWQWTAGTGTDPSPFHRVFNPTVQAERFDPEGTYIRRWVPELGALGPPEVHQPWTASGGPPGGYPAPIVDHAEERAAALDRLRVVQASGAEGAAPGSRAR
jgi:deoxyribodipyrimidine photo-lyase